MLSIATLRTLSAARLEDARVLLTTGRSEGALYLCGYAVELALKARICETLDWDGFPDSGAEFHFLHSFKTHDLSVLLHLSGVEKEIKLEKQGDWDVVSKWKPEVRYIPLGADPALPLPEAMVSATEQILGVL